MKGKALKILLLILIAVLATSVLFACNTTDDGDTPTVTPGDTDDSPSSGDSSATINKAAIFGEIKDGLLNAGSRVDALEQGVRHVTSEFTLRANSANIAVYYEANYVPEKTQDSEIMLHIYDYYANDDALFVYYDGRDLYYSFKGHNVIIEAFGGSSSFETFYNIITLCDIQSYIFGEDFSSMIEQLATFADSKNISRIKLSATESNVTVKDINLDKFKTTVNDFIDENVASLGTKFDALTSYILGFEISDLASIQVGLLTAKELFVTMETVDGDVTATGIDFTFAGNQSNNIDDYYVNMQYSTSYEHEDITVKKTVDPDVNVYEKTLTGHSLFTGTLEIPYLDEEFTAEIRAILDSEQNGNNKVYMTFSSYTESDSDQTPALAFYYKDGIGYLDCEGLIEKHFGDFVDYKALGLPKLKFTGINLATELKKVGLMFLEIASDGFDLDAILSGDELSASIATIIEKSSSNNGVFSIRIDSEFVENVIGGASSVAEIVAEYLGVDDGIVREIIDLGYFDDVAVILSYNTNNGDISVVLEINGEAEATLALTPGEVPADGIEIVYPDANDKDYFTDGFSSFVEPEVMTASFEAKLNTLDSDNGNISAFMGLFVGDVSGKNTPYPIKVSDNVVVKGSLSQKGEDIYVSAVISINDVVAVSFMSDPNDAEKVYVSNELFGVKYIMSENAMAELLTKIASEGSVWTVSSVADALSTITENANVAISGDNIIVSIAPFDEASGKRVDPLYELLGIKEFKAELALRVHFDMYEFTVNRAEYVEPDIRIEAEEVFESIYQAKWQDTVTVAFGSETRTFKLTFEGDSAIMVNGKYEYHPEAKLLGKTVTYALRLSDTVNGTKVIKKLADTLMVIDPIDENPIPEKLGVVYEDGSSGSIEYEITDFPYNNDNVGLLLQGKERAKYNVVIGKGSISETKFDLSVEVTGRAIATSSEDRYGDIPIVARVTIDPFEYYIRKVNASSNNLDFYPIIYRDQAFTSADGATIPVHALALTFYKSATSSETYTEYIEDFEWTAFDESWINYNGGVHTVVGEYKTLKIALEISVQNKKVDYVRINGGLGGYYTVDTLVTSSYEIPSISIAEKDEKGNDTGKLQTEVRIYFTSGKYRILGAEPEGYVNDDTNFDGFYGVSLDWNYKEANYLSLDAAAWPLDGETDTTVASFGNDLVGTQSVTLKVLCPTRRVDGFSDFEKGITYVDYDEAGNVIDESIVYSADVRLSYAWFDNKGGTEKRFFEFDPYSSGNAKLPEKVYLNVSYDGETALRAYDVVWSDENGIITTDGSIRLRLATEDYFIVYGTVGDGEITQTLTMGIHNSAVRYSKISMFDESNDVYDVEIYRYDQYGNIISEDDAVTEEAYRRLYVTGLIPYKQITLPYSLNLEFSAESGMSDQSKSALIWYTDVVKDGVTETILATEYVPNPKGEEIVVYTEVGGTDGNLSQRVELYLSFDGATITQTRVYGVYDSVDGGNLLEFENGEGKIVYYAPVDTYKAESQALYDKLTEGVETIGIGLTDGGQVVYGISVEWTNLAEFLSVLESPFGSDKNYNPEYEGGVILLKGIIRKGTVQEAEVSMGFMVYARVLGAVNFNSIEEQYTRRGDDGITPIQVDTQVEKASINRDTHEVTVSGSNVINMVFNKIFTLRAEGADGTTALCSPSEYINYIFGAVSLSVGSDVHVNALAFKLPEKLDEYIYGNETAHHESIAIAGEYVILTFEIEKLSPGSCKQKFTVKLTFLKDASIISGEDASGESVEVFDANGNPLYETTDGYVLGSNYVVEYKNSGKVTYNNLVWRAEETVVSASGSQSIAAGSVVKNIDSAFFGFIGTRTVKLYTTLPNGARYRRHISFYSKNINGDKYSTADSGKYKVIDGVLTINNVYEYMPVSSLVAGISTRIVPNETDSYISEYTITFSLIDGWKPATAFAKADNPDEFDLDVLSERINSNGLARTLFATGEIRGYNGETQTVKLYISVVKLSGGQISHADYDIEDRNLVYDQYGDGERTGVFELPKDITVTFGTINPVTYTFAKNADIKYYIKEKDSDTFTEITSITYNNKGHTLNPELYGGPNESLLLKIVLPDGNDGLRLTVTFPNREIDKVSYAHSTANGVSYIEGRYYVDPYDRSTYALPTEAGFMYKGGSDVVTHAVKWTPYGNAEDVFVLDANGNYVYKGEDVTEFGSGYLFYSSMPSFDDDDCTQYFIMQVFVLDRTIENVPAKLDGEYYIENPFTARVTDILSEIASDAFVTLSAQMPQTLGAEISALVDELVADNATISCFDGFYTSDYDVYADYLTATSPVVPDIEWHKMTDGTLVPLVDDDLSVYGGYRFKIYGVVGYGEDRTSGEIIELELYADTWRFERIDGIDEANGYIVELNEYTGTSIADSFTVYFLVTDALNTVTSKYITFYPADRADAENELRAVIKWRTVEGETLSAVELVNTYKTGDKNAMVTDAVYRLDKQQVGIDEIDFGYGYGASGDVKLVIDPLNPSVPLVAEARGALKTDKGTLIDLGSVNVDWVNRDSSSTESVYNMPIGGGTREIQCEVNVEGSDVKFKFAVVVTYLNRKPYGIYTEESGYTTGGMSSDGYYTLLQTAVSAGDTEQKQSYFTVNPTPQNSSLFVLDGSSNVYYKESGATEYSKSAYILPKELRVTYAGYAEGSIEKSAIELLGEEVYITDIEWVLSKDITLVGTSITAKIRKFNLRCVYGGKTVATGEYDYLDVTTILGGQYDLTLKTLDRSVEYTYIIQDGVTKRLSEIPEGSTIAYQKASDEFYIDPYAISFPDDVYVVFTDSATPYHATDIEWTYDEDFISRTDVISGKIGLSYMFLMGTLRVFGTELSIQFPIKGRNIDVTVITPSGEETQQPLSGGTLYVIKGEPVDTQLPDHLYYKFEYDDGSTQVASVPLEFSETAIKNINTEEAGRTYTDVKATLGKVDDDNIEFTIIVVEPKLYTIEEVQSSVTLGGATITTTSYENGGFYSDFISIGVNSFGAYVAGPEVGLLPNKVVITEDGAYMDIVGIEYNVADLTATVKCRYTFLSFGDSSDISGGPDIYGDEHDKMYVTFTVPIKTYKYNEIEASTAEFAKRIYTFPLGEDISASMMPDTESGITPFWEMSGVNRNKAGIYEATCYFKNAYGKIITGSVQVEIEKAEFSSENVTWNKVGEGNDAIDFLDRSYSGEELDISEFITIDNFLREDGTMGALEGYTVLYSIDGGINWSKEQPKEVKQSGAANYLVRITIDTGDDYNVQGYAEYEMSISRYIIDPDDIYFFIEENGVQKKLDGEVEFEYNGKERLPQIAGIPTGAQYTTVLAHYNPESTNQAYNKDIKPISAGDYIMKLEFIAGQRNYVIDSSEIFTIVIKINPRSVTYSLVKELEYTGEYMDAVVNNLPDELKSKAVFSYIYQYGGESKRLAPGEKMRDAGTYLVSVTINGEGNYPDANFVNEEVKILPRKVKLSINTVESEYLDPLVALNSAITVTSVDNPEEDGLVGTDKMSVFGDIEVIWDGGLLTYKHMVGSYTLVLKNGAPTHKNYEFVEVENGVYNIVAYSANTRVIDNKADFDSAVEQLRDGDTARWYLRAGEYGDLKIDVNASVSIIGSYDLTSETESIAVMFDTITLNKGAIQLDIVSVKDRANGASVTLGAGASYLNISRSEFRMSGKEMLSNSVAIRTSYDYTGTVYVDSTTFTGFRTAIYAEGGSLEVTDSEFTYNANGIVVRTGSLLINGNKFIANSGVAVNLTSTSADATISVLNNVFRANDVAVRSTATIRKDVMAQNEFTENTIAIEQV